jgi:putative NIF3 family GTP cyclohydrolase 1 type 2
MNTDQLMSLALTMAGLSEIPGDSAVYHPGSGIKRLMMGIDIQAPELKIAADLGYDAAVSHHPTGGEARLQFYRVLYRHVDQMAQAGVPHDVASALIDEMADAHRAAAAMTNYDHDPSVARLLGLPYLNIHTPLDEVGRRRLQAAIDELPTTATVDRLISHLFATFGEFRNAKTEIESRIGKRDNAIGKTVMSHGAGTNGGYAVAKAYFDHGVDTVVYIHCRPEESRRLMTEVGDSKNLIVTGHIASDSIGINPYVARLRQEGMEVTTLSGIIPAGQP